MNQRTFSEIRGELNRAREAKDAEAIVRYAHELEALGTPEALATAATARGTVYILKEGNASAAMDQFQAALALYSDANDDQGAAGSLTSIAGIYLELGEYDIALEYLYRALDLRERTGDPVEIARTKDKIGRVLNTIGNDAEAFSLLHQALDAFTALGKDKNTALSLNNLGNLLKNSGQYPEALEYYSRALSLFEQLADQDGIALVTDNIGSLYYMTEDYVTAIEYRERALSYYESINDERSIAGTFANIGNIHVVKGDLDLGLEYYRRAHEIATRFGMQRDIARTTGLILGVLVRKGLSAEADELLATLDAMTISSVDDSLYKEACRAMLQEHRGEFDLAKSTLLGALAIAQERNMPFEQAGFHDQLKDLALKQNDLAAYVEHSNAYKRIIEETNGKETTARLAIQAAERQMAKERSEHEKHLAILHSTLPKHIADRVSRGEQVNDHYNNAAVIFLDIVDFTSLSASLDSSQVVELLESIFSTLDDICKKHDVVKIKTIGDSYMAVAFPTSDRSPSDNNIIPNEVIDTAHRAALAALDMLHAVSHIVSPVSSPVKVRLGIHSGALTAGVIGKDRLQYDVWGDTVNVASRMESSGEPGRIHVSEAFASSLAPLRLERGGERSERGEVSTTNTSPPSPLSSLRGGTDLTPLVIPSETRNEEPGTWHLAPRGEIEIKGKGTMRTYWLESPLS